MSDSLLDDSFEELFEDDNEGLEELVKQPKVGSKMRRIEELIEQKKLLKELDDFADDESVNLTDFDERYDDI